MKINGTTVITPSAMDYNLEDIDSEAIQNVLGFALRDRIATKRLLSCKWSGLSESEGAQIITLTEPAFFTVTYYEPRTAAEVTKTFYATSRTVQFYSLAADLPRYSEITIELREQQEARDVSNY